jgi:hypothetical protein
VVKPVDTETTPVGSVNQGISLPNNNVESLLELESGSQSSVRPHPTRRDRRTRKNVGTRTSLLRRFDRNQTIAPDTHYVWQSDTQNRVPKTFEF